MAKTNRPAREMLDTLQETAEQFCIKHGGHPNDFRIVGEHLVIASIDHRGAPDLCSMSLSKALSKFARANRLHRDDGLEWWEAIGEVGLNS